MGNVTRILEAVRQGHSQASEELLPLVYDELRRLAAQRLSREKPGQTLQATELVHEAYLRLIGSESQRWNGRRHFFAAAAEAMRRILVEHARRRASDKHGGGRQRQDLRESRIVAPATSRDLLALNDALDELAAADPMAAELVKLRWFAGFTMKETAQIVGVAPRKADLTWAYARAWLRRRLEGD